MVESALMGGHTVVSMGTLPTVREEWDTVVPQVGHPPRHIALHLIVVLDFGKETPTEYGSGGNGNID